MAEASRKPDPEEEWESLVDRLWPEAPETCAPSERPEILSIYAEDDRVPKHWREQAERQQDAPTPPAEAATLAESNAPLVAADSIDPTPTARRSIASWLWPTLAIVLALSVGWFASAPCPAISPDSVQYLSAARNIADGHGLTTSVTPLEITLKRVPFSAWPPLYPMILAVGERVGLLPWARAVNLLAFALTLIPLAVIGRELLGPRWLPFALIAYALFRPALVASSFVWSEATFTLWATASLACLLVALKTMQEVERTAARRREEMGPIDSDLLWMLAAGLFASLASLTRYTGSALILAGGITIVLRSGASTAQATLRRIVAFLLPAGLPLAAWCLRNQRLTGHLFGESRQPAIERPAAVILDTIRTIGRDWVLPPVAAHPRVEQIALWIAGAAAVTLVLTLVQRFGPEMTERSEPGHNAAVALTTYLSVYLLLVVISAMRISTDAINTRLLAPAYPALLLLIVMMLRGAQDGAAPWLRRTVQGIALIFFTMHIATGLRYATAPRETQELTTPYWRSVIWSAPGYVPPEQKVIAALPHDALILSNVWDRISLHTGHPVKPLPGRDEPSWRGDILKQEGAYVVVDETTRQNRVGVAELETIGAYPPGLERLGSVGEVRVYRVRGELGRGDIPSSVPLR